MLHAAKQLVTQHRVGEDVSTVLAGDTRVGKKARLTDVSIFLVPSGCNNRGIL